MKDLLKNEFGIDVANIKKLNGYENFNYLISTEKENFIFKTYTPNDDLIDLIEAENDALLFLNNQSKRTPTPIPFLDGKYVKPLIVNGQELTCRLLSFLEGQFLGDVKHSESLLSSFGTAVAQLDLKLQSFKSYTIKARKFEWDIQHLFLNEKYIQDILVAKDRALVNYFFQQFIENVEPVINNLRFAYIHNDTNEWNVLTNNDKVTGIIDFGDLTYSPLINELAVSLTYICYDKEEPLEWVDAFIRTYHKVIPLRENELSVLYYCIAAKLCISVCNSAHSRLHNPDNSYAFSSEENAWKMLYKWVEINPIKAENQFRKAAGFNILKSDSLDGKIEDRFESLSEILSLSYKTPIHMTKAAFQFMYDGVGNTYLDAYNNIPHVGHCHPEVVNAGQNQMAKLNTNTRYLYDNLAEYSKQLLAKFPDQLSKVFFVNSGSAASDLAIRLAKFHTKNYKLMVMEHGYHGHTQNGIDISDYKFNNKKGDGQKAHIIKTVIPDTYRGTYTNNDGTAGKEYANDAIKLLANEKIAAFISEPIVGCGGQVPLAKRYLKELYPVIRKNGGVCISDEVQTGFGRLGDYFWGFEAQDVIPDIVVIGKPMGNSHPMGAVICTEEIAKSFEQGVEFFSSFGGNPVSCDIGKAVLNVIETEELQQNAKVVGNYYLKLFNDLANDFECIGDVRGSGLFIGVEIVKDKISKIPDYDLAQHIKNELKNNFILISTDGPFDSVIKSKPPLCFTKKNAKRVVDTIRTVLEKRFK